MGDGALTPQQAAAALLKRRRARDSLLGFVEAIDVPGDPADADDEDCAVFLPVGSAMALHHKLLCEKLQACMTTRYGRLMVFMPPGSAKSTYCSVVAPTWYMGKFPGAQIILAMHNGDLAKKQGSKARAIIRQKKYRDIFDITLSKETSAKEMWVTSNGAEYMAAGIQSGVTGNRALGMIIDDPIKGRRDADSPTVRAAVLDAYQDDLLTRMKPGGWMVLVQTRWHVGDLAGSLLPDNYDGRSGPVECKDGLVWEVVNIPAEAVREDDPLGRPVGGMLWPEYFDERHWVPLRRNNRTWNALCQQNPVPDSGGQFEREWFESVRYERAERPKHLNRFCASDYAVTELEDDNDPDFTVHGIAGVDSAGTLWMLDWFREQCNSGVGINALLALCKRNGVRRGFGEVGIIRRAIEPAFKRAQRDKKYSVAIEYLPSISDKVAKVQSFRALAMNGQVRFPANCAWADKVIDMLCAFPAVAHDDDIDVCGLFGRALDEMAFASLPAGDEPDPSLKPYSVAWLMHGTDAEAPSGPRTM